MHGLEHGALDDQYGVFAWIKQKSYERRQVTISLDLLRPVDSGFRLPAVGFQVRVSRFRELKFTGCWSFWQVRCNRSALTVQVLITSELWGLYGYQKP